MSSLKMTQTRATALGMRPVVSRPRVEVVSSKALLSRRASVATQAMTAKEAHAAINAQEDPRLIPGNAKSVGAIILGGGAGSRLYPLTKTRAKPAVPIGGAYRLIDVPMSNCLNCGINKIYILTQFNSTSLNRHLSKTYNLQGSVAGSGFVEVLAATQTPTDTDWFQGTADAVRQYSWIFADVKNRNMEDIVILSGDHLYRMDYMKFVDYHRQTGSDVTIGCLPCNEELATSFGLMKIDDDANITEFAEKPKGAALQAMRVDTTVLGCTAEEAIEKPYIASMGIYVFKRQALLDLLNDNPTDNDFGGETIPRASKSGMKVKAYLFNGYWEDIGTIKSFFDANLALAHSPPKFEFFDPEGPIVTSPRFLPPAKIMDSHVSDAIISHGAFVQGATIENAIVGLRSRIGKDCVIRDAMLMGADYYEDDEQRAKDAAAGTPSVGIGAGSTITNAIIDKNARIGKNVHISNAAGVDEANHESEGYFIRSGIVVVLANAVIADGTKI